MKLNRRHTLQFALGATGALLLPRLAAALEREKNGYFLTGNAVRKKSVGPIKVSVYAISHFMRELPEAKSKQAVIAMDTDKAFTWRLLRDLEVKQIHEALSEAYAMNGYTNAAKISSALGAFTAPLKEGTTVQLRYSSANKSTTLTVGGGGTATVPGVDFMQGTWSIWFGKIDQPDLGDALIQRIPANPSSG